MGAVAQLTNNYRLLSVYHMLRFRRYPARQASILAPKAAGRQGDEPYPASARGALTFMQVHPRST